MLKSQRTCLCFPRRRRRRGAARRQVQNGRDRRDLQEDVQRVPEPHGPEWRRRRLCRHLTSDVPGPGALQRQQPARVPDGGGRRGDSGRHHHRALLTHRAQDGRKLPGSVHRGERLRIPGLCLSQGDTQLHVPGEDFWTVV